MNKKLSKNHKLLFAICVIVFILCSTFAFFIANSDSQIPENGQSLENNFTDENAILEQSSETEGQTLVQNQDQETPTLEQNPESKVPSEEQPYNSNQNCTTSFGSLMLINPNFTVDTNWIAERKTQLVNITELYGIREGNVYNGIPLLDSEAAIHLNDMLNDYKMAYSGHEITTRSCFRSVGTNCGRLCYATGTSDHHTGYTCDLIDDAYGNSLDTDLLDYHPEWQWLHENSYKYGFIDRFVAHWAGGSMSEPVNVNENGTTGLYETWHYRYVGLSAAAEIATGKYNNGEYDSLEHYLKVSGRIKNLFNKTSCN